MVPAVDRGQVIFKITTFLEQIGLSVREAILTGETFVPGIRIDQGIILYDESKLTYPGDLLHEAGHLALMKPEERACASGDLEPGEGMNINSLEPAAILWSYAALRYLDLDPHIVFHENGYKDSSEWYIENFEAGNYIALPLLQWMGLCRSEEEVAKGRAGFPVLTKWLRD
ncbi:MULTISPECIES: hypothetical protein [Roseivirga]|jgi:hypothetical protein|uniref:IrrE N-terminal-like domain-containing protein n=1 Tax=Roseivirga thermotolerans TaxID=1758176 RepID=A0ABQ3I5W7_9BACT|nr:MULTISPECIES: hypothetical protein [Roseivirga]MEC7754156.1 hypothetical protein [Bacteroidota bacterium]GHE60382.1 hypothetical protein GCM10011340_14030 [Roseivirga thermotolerans]|tara:strand:- start:8232 stop:8744 length:513 start_codon:yes stop_codon:yes gene_type:complete